MKRLPIFGDGGLLWYLRGELCRRGWWRCKVVPINEQWASASSGTMICAYCWEPREVRS